jgi:alpha-L-rhamnosidase
MNKGTLMKRCAVFLITLLSVSGVSVHADGNNAIRLYDLKIEHMKDPIQLDVRQPRLSCKIETTDPNAKEIQQKNDRIRLA